MGKARGRIQWMQVVLKKMGGKGTEENKKIKKGGIRVFNQGQGRVYRGEI